MIRDPFFRQIKERLNEHLDPELFEQCAADLLRAAYPTLAPVQGSPDAGRDGVIADGDGEAFPLVTTTAEDVIGNLTRNLQSYVEDGGKRRKVVLATSQELTLRRKRNLENRAEELSFTLINIHDQDAFANLLYRSPEWCLELLNLTGTPPALSVLPQTDRPLLNQRLIGRETDLNWLQTIENDSVFVGQPGSGKTFLLHKLALEGEALFVVSTDRTEIANGIRSQQPTIVIVDDASVKRDLLTMLLHLREQLEVEFLLLASCWPGDRQEIAHLLNIPKLYTHQIDLLSRDDIVEVIKGTGLHGPNALIREIVNQAEGRPGLAITLAHLCLRGGVREVALGDALSTSFLTFFRPLIGDTISDILGAFSLGGDAGMPMGVVANGLDLKLSDVRHAVIKLAAGGTVLDVDRHHISVRPPALRHALVRETFFKGAMSLPISPLLAQVPDLAETARTLIGAKARGAEISPESLTRLLKKAQSIQAWKEYVLLGHSEAKWVLKQYPEMVLLIANPALQRAPETTIPLLLDKAIGDKRKLHSTPDHPLRIVGDWISAGHPGTSEAMDRRRCLLEAVLSWLPQDTEVELRCFRFVMCPSYRAYTTDPGSGYTVTIRSSFLLPDEISEVQDLWPQVFDAIKKLEINNWNVVCDIVEMWAYPGRGNNADISAERYKAIQNFAGVMLLDLISIAEEHPAVCEWASQIAKHIDLEAEIPLDQAFETLYPARDYSDSDDWQVVEKRNRQRVRELANEWSRMPPEQVIRRITLIEQEANLAPIRGIRRWTPTLCIELADTVSSPSEWTRVMIRERVTSEFVEPFLWKVVERENKDWVALASACLDEPNLESAAISLVLKLSDPPEDLLSEAMSRLERFVKLVEIICLRGQVSERVLTYLLQHEIPPVAEAAANGTWLADPEGTIPDAVQEVWRRAMIKHVTEAHWLPKAFNADFHLAYQWLEARAKSKQPMWFTNIYKQAIKAAGKVINTELRTRILHQVPAKHENTEFVLLIVDNNLELYQELLSIKEFKLFHLAPLSGHPEGIWFEKAKLALRAEYSSQEIAHAVFGPVGIITFEWTGKESEMWKKWIARFERLCTHEDKQIQKIGDAGKAYATDHLERALERERREAIYGM